MEFLAANGYLICSVIWISSVFCILINVLMQIIHIIFLTGRNNSFTQISSISLKEIKIEIYNENGGSLCLNK